MTARPRHTAFAAATLTVAALLCSCSNGSGEEPAAVQPAAAEPPAAQPAPGLSGTWHAGPAPYTDVVAALQDAGLGQAADAVLQGNKASSQVSYDLKLKGGFVLLTSAIDDQPQGVQDREAYTFSAEAITLTPIGSPCSSTFTWAVDGDQLTLDLSEDTCPDYEGTSDAAYMTALYAALPFQRVGG